MSNYGKAQLTAEWTVHAQLKITRPDLIQASQPEWEQHQQQTAAATTTEQQEPVTFVYNWSSDEKQQAKSDSSEWNKCGGRDPTKFARQFDNVSAIDG